jgi:hypothetical protein
MTSLIFSLFTLGEIRRGRDDFGTNSAFSKYISFGPI